MALIGERDRLLGQEDLTVQDQALLAQIQVVLYIVVESLFRDSEILATAMREHPKEAVAIIQNAREVSVRGFDISKFKDTKNKGLFL